MRALRASAAYPARAARNRNRSRFTPDLILVRYDAWGPTLAVDRCDRFLDLAVGNVWASDHFGVTADLIRQ